MTDFVLDWEREKRTGVAEAVLCEGKSVAQVDAILGEAGERRLLLTRLDESKHAGLAAAVRAKLDFDPLSRTAFHGAPKAPALEGAGIVCAGTSDLPVAREAARSLAFAGFAAPRCV